MRIAGSFGARLLGLMGRKDVSGEALLIPRCGSIHTFFMRTAIDVIFMDEENRVIRTISELRPWRTAMTRGERLSVLELPPGTIRRMNIRAGDVITCLQD